MKKLAAALFAVVFTTLLFSCRNAEPQTVQSSPPSETDDAPAATEASVPEPEARDTLPVEVTFYTDSIEVTSRVTLVAEATYPKTGVEGIDVFYTGRLAEFIAFAEKSADEYRNYDDINSAVTQYDLHESFEVVRNSGGIFSIHRTVYNYSGGAHGNHSDSCDNFTFDGRRIELSDLFVAPEDEYVEDILAAFGRFIESESKKPDGYRFFDGAAGWLRDEFPAGNFCIGDEGLIFFISPYYISAYSEGTIVIPVAWDDISAPKLLQ